VRLHWIPTPYAPLMHEPKAAAATFPEDELAQLGVNSVDRAGIQRRTLRTLMGGIVPGGAAMSSAYSSAAILGEELTSNQLLGGIAASGLTTGAAITAIPLARVMARRGRRVGIAGGYAIAGIGAFACLLAAQIGWYPLLVLGMLSVGMGYASNMAARFASADLADEPGSAIGMLIWASTFGSVLGPLLGFGPLRSLATRVGLHELAGPYLLSILLFGLAALAVHLFLRPDPLVVAGGLGNVEERESLRSYIRPIVRSSDGRLAVGSMVVGHVVMVGIMTMMPLHMRSGGHGLQVIGAMISLHIVGMYAFSPIVGRLVDRLGPHRLIVVGSLLLAVGADVAAHDEAHQSLSAFVGMFIVGIGWSCGLIASSALLVRTFDGPNRVGIQGLADMCMTTGGASAAIVAGFVLELSTFPVLGHGAAVVGGLPAVAVLIRWLSNRRVERTA
jgi:MFS family permease